MEELFGIPDDSEETEDAAHDFQSLLWSVKIDEESFFEIIEKCRLRRLLRQANYGVEESMNKLFAMMDKVCTVTGFTIQIYTFFEQIIFTIYFSTSKKKLFWTNKFFELLKLRRINEKKIVNQIGEIVIN